MCFALVVSLYTSRVILNTLGVEDFGVYNVVAGFVSMFGFLNATLSASIQRFYNFEIGLGSEDGVRHVYVIGLVIQILLAVLLLIILESFGLWYVNNIMVVPPGREFAVNALYQCCILSMILVVLQIPYVGAVMAYENMAYFAIVSSIDVVLKLGIAISLPFLPYDKLVSYGVLLLAISLIDFSLYFIYSKMKFPAIKLERFFDKKLFKKILSFSGWNLLGTFAHMFKNQGLNLELNYFFGPVVNAARGIAFQVSGALGNFTSSITTSFRPQVVSSFAQGNEIRAKRMMFTESKVSFILVILLAIPLIEDTESVLNLWLGEGYPELAVTFVQLCLVDSIISILNPPISQLVFAHGSIKRFQILSTTVNLLLPLFGLLLLKSGCTPSSVFVATICFTTINQMVCVYSASKLVKFSIKEYMSSLLPCFTVSGLMLCTIPVWHMIMDASLYRFFIVLIANAVLYLTAIYFFALNPDEKTAVQSLAAKVFKHKRND